MGMGGLGGSTVEKIPTPQKNIKGQVLDREGVKTSLSQFSMEGKVFLIGKRGDADVAIPFEDISQTLFQNPAGNDALVRVLLRDGKEVEIKIDKRSKFYGKAEFGTFLIEAKDLKSISFQP